MELTRIIHGVLGNGKTDRDAEKRVEMVGVNRVNEPVSPFDI